MSKPFFRASVGAMILDRQGRVLACQRADQARPAWQMPQGGLELDEAPLDAAYREVLEETGIARAQLELLAVAPEWLSYELPAELRSKKTGLGQTQRWFLFRFLGRDAEIRLDPSELRAFEWWPAARLLEHAVEFRRPVYTRIIDAFAPHLSAS